MIRTEKNNILRKLGTWLPLFFICAGSLLLVLPTVDNNIDDPNMIIYFNADAGGLMDQMWYYYSGEKRPSYQWNLDYGLEMLYFADFARLLLSRFMNFTPGTFVLIFRWLHLIAWICALIALWRLISYHFGKGWQPFLAVILLAVRPAFAYCSSNLKPEPLVLFLMIVGLDYTLRFIENPSKRSLFIAIAMASLAFIVKFAGLFLLPAIVASIYFSNGYQNNANRGGVVSPKLKISWILPSLLGLIMIVLPLLMIVFYVRNSTGSTWYEEFGFWASLLRNKLGLYSFLAGIFFIFLTVIIWILNRNGNPLFKKIIKWINEINSYALVVIGIFVGFVLLFGFRWVISPRHFIQTCSLLCVGLPTGIAKNGFFYSFFQNLIVKIAQFDPIIISVFIFYFSLEIYNRKQTLRVKSLESAKRFVLLVFLMPFLILMFTMLRVVKHHMLPFFVVTITLVIQGINMFISSFSDRKLLKNMVVGFICILLIVDVGLNGISVIKASLYQFNQKEDIAFDVAKWFKENIPVDARIVAEHYNSVYIPPGYKNIKTLNWNLLMRNEQLRQFADTYHPQLIYYNENSYGGTPMEPIEKILPGKKVKLIKAFDSGGRRYQRIPGDKFVIYKVLY